MVLLDTELNGSSDSGPKDACGVFGVYAPGQPVAHLSYLGLYALQHRGQESAGIAVSDGETITVVKDMGLVTQVFDERRLAPLEGHLAIGHVRYSTTGSSTWRNAQPVYRSVGEAGIALGHNGNLTNTVELAESLGMLPGVAKMKDQIASANLDDQVAERGAPRVAGLPSAVQQDDRRVGRIPDRVADDAIPVPAEELHAFAGHGGHPDICRDRLGQRE